MRFPPPAVIASWPRPNYSNPETRGPTLMIVELTILPLALICLALRLYVRMFMIKKSWWDDWLMIASAFCCIGVTISVILATQLYGWNVHTWDLTYKQMVQGRQVSIAGQTIFVFASGFAKLSILASYLRIALPGSWLKRLTWTTIVIVAAAIPAFLMLLWLQCRPSTSYWNLFVLERDCMSEWPPLAGQTIVTVITDFIVYILPMPTLWKLQLPLSQRISLMVLFGFGGIVVVAGCMRTYWVHYVELETYDVTWEGFYLWIWAAVEVNLGVICGCAPVLKPLLFSSRSRRGTQYNQYNQYNRSKSSTLDTIGSLPKKWSRKTRISLKPAMIASQNDYIDLESLESGAGIAKPVGTANSRVQFQDPPENNNTSPKSLELPLQPPTKESPSIPKAVVTNNIGRFSGFFFTEQRRLKTESWIDDKSDDGVTK